METNLSLANPSIAKENEAPVGLGPFFSAWQITSGTTQFIHATVNQNEVDSVKKKLQGPK